ncbi:MAG: lipopolysaccharide heptosyltransferase II [Magnetococcales bacterium]|nr:lipopolysaccharide heptosyltransferase II [Magnetococcales bacterium]
MPPPEDILVIGPAWVGDMVMAQALFLLLKQRHPERAIDVVAPGWSQPLLRRMPEVRDTFCLDVGHGQLGLRQRWHLGQRLRGQYGQAIVLPNSFKSALVPFHADIAVRTGFLGEWRWGLLNDVRHLDKKSLPRTVDRFVALGLTRRESLPATLPLPVLAAPRAQAMAAVGQWLDLREGVPVVVLCPGAEYGPAKRWPADRFAGLATALLARGWRVVVCGSAKERELGAQIATAAGPGCLNLAGQTTLNQVVDLLSLAHCVVSNDSGLMHVAAALGRPVIALFGSSDPHHTPPLGGQTQVITLGLPCAPCFRRECPEKHLRCLTGITVESVLAQVAGGAWG